MKRKMRLANLPFLLSHDLFSIKFVLLNYFFLNLFQPKPAVNNTEKDVKPVEEAAKKDEPAAEKPSEVNNVDSKVEEDKTPAPEKPSKEISTPEKVEEAESNENKAPSEEAAPAKGVAQEPVAVSQ